jgi:hypothetical protein
VSSEESKIQLVDGPPTERLPAEDENLEVGQWYWTENGKEKFLGCITYIGSNFVKVQEAGDEHRSTIRVHFDEFDEYCVRRELEPDKYIAGRVESHRSTVNQLMGKVKQLCSKLGLTPAGELVDGSKEVSTALAVAHGTEDIKAHKTALIKAKDETLPALFEEIEAEHKQMATWMKASLIPLYAETSKLKRSTAAIEDRIFTVELYAGLTEDCELIRDGEPAGNDEKVHLFQRRHYMDEECLAQYKAGGMDFRGIRAFDRWLMKNGNRERILPKPKCIVAFKVRRFTKDYAKWQGARSLSDFITFSKFKEMDEWTFLYMRNGDKYYRLDTAIEFGSSLFPDVQRSKLLAKGQLYIKKSGISSFRPEEDLINEREYFNLKEDHRRRKTEHRAKVAKWKAMTPKEKKSSFEPHAFWDRMDTYVPLTQDHTYYDDAMRLIKKAAMEHNRVAVVLQGLLDRSPVFHPHPPWQLWTPEGFASGIELVYDLSRAVPDGDPPDFEEYRRALNEGITTGTRVVGQRFHWMRKEAEKENERQANDWRIKYRSDYFLHEPYGNPGPAEVAKVEGMSRDKAKAKFSWTRERQQLKRDWGTGGWDESRIPVKLAAPIAGMLNVDAYTPGDYKRFYNDPRTRASYMKWAPLMLMCEDYYGSLKKKKKQKKKKGK